MFLNEKSVESFRNVKSCHCKFIFTVQNLKKELHLPSPFAKTGDLFLPDLANQKDWFLENGGFWFGGKFKLGNFFELCSSILL